MLVCAQAVVVDIIGCSRFAVGTRNLIEGFFIGAGRTIDFDFAKSWCGLRQYKHTAVPATRSAGFERI